MKAVPDPMTPSEARAAIRHHRQEARARLELLRGRLKLALAAKKARMRAFVEECKKERLTVRGAILAMRDDALAVLRAEIQTAEKRAREQRSADLREIRKAAGTSIDRARAAIEVERRHSATRRDLAEHVSRRKAEIDHAHAKRLSAPPEITAKLEKLRPLLQKAQEMTPLPGESRTEALWRHARANPEQMHAVLEPKAEQTIEKTRAEIADTERSIRAPNAYELKRAARVERLRARAEKARAGAEGAFARERAIGSAIPMGQPILVGHHSERRHRRDLERLHSLVRKGIGLTNKAEELERRAASAESNRAISSDDPEALSKLRQKLATLEAKRKTMREANAILRRKGAESVPSLQALGFSEARAKELLQKDFAGRIGFPDYALTNASAEARRLEERIRHLEKAAASPARPAEAVGGASIAEADNRVRITFPGKPADDVRRALKASGFRWSPTVGAWQRFASPGAWAEARRVLTHVAASPAPPLPSRGAPPSSAQPSQGGPS